MKSPRKLSSLFTLATALFCMLFVQGAIAAFVCPMLISSPNLTHAPTEQIIAMDMSTMPDCAMMEATPINQCATMVQDQHTKLSSDTSPFPEVQAFIPNSLFFVLADQLQLPARPTPKLIAIEFDQVKPPPISILHCCFRI